MKCICFCTHLKKPKTQKKTQKNAKNQNAKKKHKISRTHILKNEDVYYQERRRKKKRKRRRKFYENDANLAVTSTVHVVYVIICSM